MHRAWLATGAAILAIGTAQSGVMAQPNDIPEVDASIRDPETIAALARMGDSLRKLQSFAVIAETTEEKVLTTGQKVQFGGIVDIKMRRPDGLRVDKVSDRQARSLYFDGKTLTLDAPRVGFYGSAPAPGTIREAVAMAADYYDIDTPLADLLTWGDDPAVVARVINANYIGAETIGGHACDHYAMRQIMVDWQIWIRQGPEALPCKVVITSTDDPSMPQYSAVFNWTPHQTHAAGTFTFKPRPDSHKIALGKAPDTVSVD